MVTHVDATPESDTRGVRFVCVAGALRAFVVGAIGVLLAVYFAATGIGPTGLGVVIGCGIAGNALATVAAGYFADQWGRRRAQIAVAGLSGAAYVALAHSSDTMVLAIIAFVGLVNGMGRDRGPASALDQAILPALVPDTQRTWAFAWYNAAVDCGHGVGALAAALPSVAVTWSGVSASAAHRGAFIVCGILLIVGALPYAMLGRRAELSATRLTPEATHIDPATRNVVRRISLLFAVDSIGGGFLASPLIAYWFLERYGASGAQLAVLFFSARVLNVVSHLAAAGIARRIGLLNTMVWTHLPSSLVLMAAPSAPSAAIAVALFLVREALVEMDVPTRQSYVMAVVPPGARTYASSMTNVTRTAGWAVGPFIAGPVMQHVALSAPLFIGGILKVIYDVALYRSFTRVVPPEEQHTA